MREEKSVDDEEMLEKQRGKKRASFWTDLQEGWKYIARYPLVMAIMGGAIVPKLTLPRIRIHQGIII